ncbi:MAG TPA: tetratricopeptide repeat protein [Candidatus Angelobacter sp.]
MDKNYLSLQFWNNVYQKSGTEFQAFFEKIMERTPGFQKIKPYGNEGDKGNDGYCPAEGIYYQVYAPTEPGEKEADAAQKFKDDFAKLKNGWDKIATIKRYNFVYNDKGSGLTIKLETARAELRAANPSIEFKVFTPKDLEKTFFTLNADQIASLGFDVDSRNAVQNVRDYLVNLEAELDKESGEFVLRALQNIRDIIARHDDEALLLDFEIVEARALQKNEKVREARDKYENIIKRYPDDPRSFLYLAEIYLNNEDFVKNAQLLQRAEHISPGFWLLTLEKLIREIRLRNRVDPLAVDEQQFPSEPRAKSNFYRVYSVLLDQAGEVVRAESFIERAIHLNPDRFSNHDVKIALLEDRVFVEPDINKRRNLADAVLNDISAVEKRFNDAGGIGPRSQSWLNIRRLHMHFAREDTLAIEATAKDLFGQVINCYPDLLMEKIIADLIRPVELPQVDFLKLQDYVKQADKLISDFLAKALVLQFLHKKSLFTEGKAFFSQIKKQDIVDLIMAVEEKNYARAVDLVKDDVQLAVDFVVGIKEPSELRWKIVEALPDDGTIQKEKLFLLLYHQAGDTDKAFEILQKMDLSKLNYAECLPTLKIAQDKKAWDSVVILLEKLLNHEKNKTAVLQIKLQLFTANINLERFPEAIGISRSILENPNEAQLLDEHNKESLVVQTTYAYLKRGDGSAKDFIQTYASLLRSFEAKVSAEAEAYLKAGDGRNALRAVVEGVKLLRHPSPEQYGMLFFGFIQLGNLMPEFTLTSSPEVGEGCFVKLKEQERWFYVGEGDELDATKIAEPSDIFLTFFGKKPGEKITFGSKYRSEKPEYEIEMILPIEKYILWQARNSAHKLSAEQRWTAMEIIEVPITEGLIDTKYLIAKLQDEERESGNLFDIYCEQNVPLALLALSEGGLAKAIARITAEQRGFIKASSGSLEELNQQKTVAHKMIAGETFYLDGTSVLMLSEIGFLQKIYEFVPNLKVPQSVISLLLELRDRFEYYPGQSGYLGYAQGRLRVSDIDRARREAIKTNFENSIRLLETKLQNISVISLANKSSAFAEQKIPASLSDACILAQKEGVAVLTEDFLYLKLNEMETKKPAPEYCCSLTLLRVLYEQRKITFDDYLEYFGYLSSYRVRFLPVTTEDLEKSVFGDQTIKVIRPEQLRQFNFPLTLSEEYGVAPPNAFQLVAHFFIKVLVDDSVLPSSAERIFAEIVSLFPTNNNRKALGRLLLGVAVQFVQKNRQKMIMGFRMQEKFDTIATFLRAYGSDEPFLLQTD